MRAERVQSTKQSHHPDRSGTGAPTRPGIRIAGWTPVLIVGLLLLLPVASAEFNTKHQVQEALSTAEDLTDAVTKRVGSPGSLLFFSEEPLAEPDDRWNFSAFPPTAQTHADHREADLQDTEGFEATWSWYLPTTPAVWNVRPGDQWDVVLYIEGLTADPDGDPDSPHPVYTIDVQAVSSAGVHANGTTETSRFDIGEGPHRYGVTAHVDEHHEFYPGKSDPQLEIQITIRAQEEVEPQVRLHYGDLETPSRLMLPRYPHHALAEMQDNGISSLEPTLKRSCREPVGDGCGNGPDDEGNPGEDGDGGSSPQDTPEHPGGSSASTVKSGQNTPTGLQEEAPEEEDGPEKEAGPDTMTTASTSGVIVLLAWTLFVASAGSYPRSDRSKQSEDVPRIVGRPKEPAAGDRPTQTREHPRRRERKE